MDHAQLVTIAVTAAITVISKDVVTWAWDLLKKIVVTPQKVTHKFTNPCEE